MLPWLLTAVMAAPSATTTRIGVLEVVVEGAADASVAGQLTGRLAEVLGNRDGVKVIAPDDIRAILEREAQKQLVGCDETSCLAEIGGALGADILIKGRAAKLEGVWAVSLAAVDPIKAESLGHVSERWGGESLGLLALVEPMVERLLPTGAALVGTLEIEGAIDGSRIMIDGQVRATAPAGQMGEIPIGAHHIQLVVEDTQPWEQWVVVQSAKTTAVAARQEGEPSSPLYTKWWFWTAGAAIVGGAVATGVILSQSEDDPINPNPGATGVEVSINADDAFTGGR